MDTSQLTFTRFIAAVLIVIFHFSNGAFPFNQPVISTIVRHADYGVSYFFLLSGFVMGVAYGKKGVLIDYLAFLKNRFARIFPLYFLALFAMLFYFFLRIKIMSMPSAYTPNIIDVLLNVFMLQSWVPDKAITINVPAWSLSVEWFFYMSFPFLFNNLYKKVNFNKLGVWTIAFFIVSQVLFNICVREIPKLGLFFFFHPLFHWNEFIVGNFVGLYFINHRPISSTKLYLGLLLSLIFIVGLTIISRGWVILSNGLLVIIFIPLLLIFAYDYSSLSTLFKKKSLQYLGEISYGMYILQFPIYFFFTALLTVTGHKVNGFWFFVYLSLLIVASAISYNFIEKPLRDRIKKIKLR